MACIRSSSGPVRFSYNRTFRVSSNILASGNSTCIKQYKKITIKTNARNTQRMIHYSFKNIWEIHANILIFVIRCLMSHHIIPTSIIIDKKPTLSSFFKIKQTNGSICTFNICKVSDFKDISNCGQNIYITYIYRASFSQFILDQNIQNARCESSDLM